MRSVHGCQYDVTCVLCLYLQMFHQYTHHQMNIHDEASSAADDVR